MASRNKSGPPSRKEVGPTDLANKQREARALVDAAETSHAQAAADIPPGQWRRVLSLADLAFPAVSGKGGGKLSRSETVTVRLDPKLRYLSELAARMHRRTLSSYIEWAIEASLRENLLHADPHGPSISDEAEYLWDVDEADRFARLAFRYPHLLTHEEQLLWKVIRECSYLWNGSYDLDMNWKWQADQASLDLHKLRAYWPTLRAVAAGNLGQDSLPTWPDGKSGIDLGNAARQVAQDGFGNLDEKNQRD